MIEPPADQRLQPVAQRLADLGVGDALNLDALDDVARVDVLDEAAVVADAGDEKDDARVAVGPRDRADGGDDVGMLGLDARGQLGESRPVQPLAGQSVELAAKAGTEVVARQARDVDRLDDRAFGWLGVLCMCGLPGRAQGEERRSSDSGLMSIAEASGAPFYK